MKLKLDENLGARGAELFRGAGHEVATVKDEGLCSASDRQLISVCRSEKRCLVTLDKEFGNPLLFRPKDYFGIAVIRLPDKPGPEHLYESIRTLIIGLARAKIENRLWIVQPDRVREYQPDDLIDEIFDEGSTPNR